MTRTTDVAIVGAGPYALSLATHLRARGVDFRIFGDPLRPWRRMPAGMCLKSAGLASNLYDPDGRFTLRRYCARNALAYHDLTIPIPLSVFTRYAEGFQRQLVPDVENALVTSVDRARDDRRYIVCLDTGEIVPARRVVVATGLTNFAHLPPVFSGLPPDAVSHSSEHADLGRFEGRDVTVVGRGSSALDIAALLHHRVKARVRVIARQAPILGVPPREQRGAWSRFRRPLSDLGTGWRLRFYSDAPMLFRLLPEEVRLWLARTELGPAGGWHLRDALPGHVPIQLAAVRHAERRGAGQLTLSLASPDGVSAIVTEHVIAATGYQVDLRRLPFLGSDVQSRIRTAGGQPVLSANFESSAPGLYFVGVMATNTFGPVMRFLTGARYTAEQLSRHLSAGGASHSRSRARWPAGYVRSRECAFYAL